VADIGDPQFQRRNRAGGVGPTRSSLHPRSHRIVRAFRQSAGSRSSEQRSRACRCAASHHDGGAIGLQSRILALPERRRRLHRHDTDTACGLTPCSCRHARHVGIDCVDRASGICAVPSRSRGRARYGTKSYRTAINDANAAKRHARDLCSLERLPADVGTLVRSDVIGMQRRSGGTSPSARFPDAGLRITDVCH